MICHVCEQQAVGQCRNCGKFYCAVHGDGICAPCTDKVQAAPSTLRPRWEPGSREHDPYRRPGPAISPFDAAPFCYACGEPPDGACGKCRRFFCADHKGRGNRWVRFCKACQGRIDFANIVAILILCLLLVGFAAVWMVNLMSHGGLP